MDEDRTGVFKRVLESIWKRIDPTSKLFDRYPFNPGAPVIPILPRGRHRKRDR